MIFLKHKSEHTIFLHGLLIEIRMKVQLLFCPKGFMWPRTLHAHLLSPLVLSICSPWLLSLSLGLSLSYLFLLLSSTFLQASPWLPQSDQVLGLQRLPWRPQHFLYLWLSPPPCSGSIVWYNFYWFLCSCEYHLDSPTQNTSICFMGTWLYLSC